MGCRGLSAARLRQHARGRGLAQQLGIRSDRPDDSWVLPFRIRRPRRREHLRGLPASATAKKSARCSACSPTRASAASPTAPSPRAASPAPPENRPNVPPTTPWATASSPTPNATAPSSTPCSASQRHAASRWRRSRWPGCSANPVVTAPIIGATKPRHLDDAAAAVDIDLTPDEHTALAEHYTVRDAGGF